MTKQKTEKKPAFSLKVLSRVVKYMLYYYKIPFILVVVCILVSAVTTVIGATFPQTLVDDYITPMLKNGSHDFSGLAGQLIRLVIIMGIGVIAAFSYNRIMVNVSQGTMRHLRDDLFSKMESLPIKYFDTHAHGDIMSVYTNDVDTLRQMLSQSILCDAAGHCRFFQTVREILYPSADGSGSRGRFYRGDAGRPEGGKGILPRGGRQKRFP